MVKILISGTEGKMDNYIRAVEAAGGIADAQYAPKVGHYSYDGLLLCGGGDLSPALLGEEPLATDSDVDPVREASDIRQIAAFAVAGKPILGICRGMQVLNVVLGGSLIRDLGGLCVIHSGHDHIAIADGGALEALFGHAFLVNSFHHQAIRVPAPGFHVTLRGPDGTVEAIEHEALPILGVQWHPERQTGGEKLFAYFLNLAKQRGKH